MKRFPQSFHLKVETVLTNIEYETTHFGLPVARLENAGPAGLYTHVVQIHSISKKPME